ncbi:hypothetical protein ACROSR_17440 [Roseovarius tibetensis]|uniref:hypothetical protein n=1 Tax=Roseovarius tibetensis TaxID=2685897 RepID=UPI003D7FC792
MKKMVVACVCTGLSACGVDDSGETDPNRFAGSGEIESIPIADERYSGDIESISYDPDSDTLIVQGEPFDVAGRFNRVSERDVRGFAAFENEGGARRYLALVRTDGTHGVSAGVVGTPVRLDREFGGTVLTRADIPELPRNVQVRHVGDYAGIRNVGSNDGGDMTDSFLHRVEGRVQLDLDFADRIPSVEGVIRDRRSLDQTVEVEEEVRNVQYDDVVMQFTSIDIEGNFTGVAAVNKVDVGAYDGMIAGDDAAASAGVVIIREGDELERGAFIARVE